MRRLFGILLLMCLGVGLVPPARGAEEPSSSTLTVLAFNLRSGQGLGQGYDLEGVAKFLKAQDADVIALQEVDRVYGRRSNNDDQPALLAKQLGYEKFYGPNIEGYFGNLLLSRRGFVTVRNYIFSKAPNNRKRCGILASTVAAGPHQVRLYNTQLDGSSTPARIGQFSRTVKILREDQLPIILCGGFNTSSASQLKRLYRTAEPFAWTKMRDAKPDYDEREWLSSTRALKGLPASDDDILISPELKPALIDADIVLTPNKKYSAYRITLDLTKLAATNPKN